MSHILRIVLSVTQANHYLPAFVISSSYIYINNTISTICQRS